MKVIIHNVFVIIGVIISLIVATFLGIFSQDISYYFNEQFPTIKLTTAITIVTFLSIGLYIIILILISILKKTNKVYLIAFVLIGLPISIWSFFVWAMWMG
ncbi:hypothetical protein [Lederbergia citrea]|uniref:Uncharacterized protein n=1 Tax=Lederbergia citrea TaxID=2833581 RepID=A0A942UPZ1_9BACI|nr:hypothetical protein [Lederbergia citrea]MBS4203413.1 hypothetical protein [Lederbergia citrea]MBS4221914.1 hypothetical protein [Lederbergia citrea]